MKNKVTTNNLKEFNSFAQSIANYFISRKVLGGEGAVVVGLVGELGVGKTTFAQTFAKTLGVEERVKSPTFAIAKKYEIRNPKSGTNSKSKISNFKQNIFKNFCHFDVYRIEDEKEILNLGWEEIISNPQNIVLVEWANKIEKILPKGSLRINFKHLKGGEREVAII